MYALHIYSQSITNHIENWIANGWKSKILACYDKLTEHAIPDHLPMNLRPKYFEYIAEEQLLTHFLHFVTHSTTHSHKQLKHTQVIMENGVFTVQRAYYRRIE